MLLRIFTVINIVLGVCLAQNNHYLNPSTAYGVPSNGFSTSSGPTRGKIIIPYYSDVYVYIDDTSIDNHPYARRTKRLMASKRTWILENLPLKQYEIRIDRTYHQTVMDTFSLSLSQPIKEIDYIESMPLLKAEIQLFSNENGVGRFAGKKSGKFSLHKDQNTLVTVPYGKYELTAQSKGFFPVKQDVSIFQKSPSPITLEFVPYNKGGAVWRSLLIPGMGQFYSRQKTKGTFFTLISGLGVGLLVGSVMEYDTELQRYNTLTENYLASTTPEDFNKYGAELDASKKRLTDLQTYFLAGASTALITYTWNLFDIAVLFPYD